MFGKLSLSVFLFASLTCVGQVVTTGGYATTAGPAATPISAANAPLISTPDIALPGSGPAVGAPLTNTNDSRTSTGPSVSHRNGFGPIGPENTVETAANPTEAPNVGTTATSNSASEPFEFGIQRFESGISSGRSPAPSLGEVARSFRGSRPQTRTYNNDSIAQLKTTGLQTGNLGGGNMMASNQTSANESGSGAPTPQSINALVAQNRAPALPQSDQESAATSAKQKASATAIQQRHAAPQQDTVASENTSPQQPSSTAADQKPSSTAANDEGKNTKLPQTGSSLPLLLVIGALGIGAGTLYLIRR